jgi:CBS domain containing-hemolysin-like protein
MDRMPETFWWWPALGLAVAGLLVAALANGVETGLYRLNRIRLRLRAASGDRRAKTLLALLADLRGLIIVCLVIYNGGAYLATVMVTMGVVAAGWVEGSGRVEMLTTAILTPIFFVFADVVPKSIVAYAADSWTQRMAGALRWTYRLLYGVGLVPALKGLSALVLWIARQPEGANPFHPRQRLRAFLREGAAEGAISGYQDELAEKVLTLREKTVGQVMIPLAHAASVPVDIGRDPFVEELRRHSYSRLPVWEGRKENVIGIVRINDVLAEGEGAGAFDLRAVMSRDVLAVPSDMPVGQAMFRMRKARAPMAVVQNASGRPVGIMTIKDLVEEIVGELAAW